MKATQVADGKLFIASDTCLSRGVCTGKCPFHTVSHESETLYRIYIGGTWGKHTRMGTPLPRFIRREEILPVLERTILWFKANGLPKERFGKTIDRVGFEKAEASILGEELFFEKTDILAE